MIYLLIAILPFTALNIFTFRSEDVLLTYFVSLLLFAILMVHVLFFSIHRFRIYFDRSLQCFALLLILIFILNLGGIGKTEKYFTQFINLAIIFLAYFTFSNILYKYNFKKIKKIMDFFILVSVVLAIFSLYQYVAVKFSLPLFDYFRNSNMYYIARDWHSGSGWTQGARTYGVAPEPTFWAAYLLVPISLLLPRIMRFKANYTQFLFFCILNLSFFLSFSRSGWVTYGGLLLIYFFNRIFKFWLHPVWVMLFSIGMVVASGIIYLMFPTITGLSFYMRIAGSLTALKMFMSHPIVGMGWGSFQQYFKQFQVVPDFAAFWESQLVFNAGFAANLYLRILAEIGLVWLFAFMAIIVSVYGRMIKLIRNVNYSADLLFFQGMLLAFYSIMITWYYSEAFNLIYIWFIIAVMAVLPGLRAKEETEAKIHVNES